MPCKWAHAKRYFCIQVTPVLQGFAQYCRMVPTCKRIADRWSLPEPLRAGTGIIFASAFPETGKRRVIAGFATIGLMGLIGAQTGWMLRPFVARETAAQLRGAKVDDHRRAGVVVRVPVVVVEHVVVAAVVGLARSIDVERWLL